MNTPNDRKYATTDEWVKVDGDIATIGISDFAQDQLSDVVFVEVAVSVGDTVKKNDTAATVESVKAAADVVFPVSGSIIEVNEALPQTPELVNSDPYTQAWMVKVKLSKPGELDNLMDAQAYINYCGERSH
jgi:glycine cleavage system H protein